MSNIKKPINLNDSMHGNLENTLNTYLALYINSNNLYNQLHAKLGAIFSEKLTRQLDDNMEGQLKEDLTELRQKPTIT